MPQISEPKKGKQAKVQCTVTFDAAEVAKAEENALQRLGRDVKLPGFRPGKAPVSIIKEKIPAEDLLEETVRSLLPGIFDAIVKAHDVQPIIPPKVELEKRDPLTLTVTMVERPEVKLKGADKIKIAKTEAKADDKDVQRMLDYLRSQYRTTSPADRAAKDGDQVTMNFVGKDEKSQEIPGTKSTGYQVILGSKTLLPGFEDAIVGLKAGDEKTFPITFPEKYHAEHLRGKTAQFTVTVTKVEASHLPELTDAFVKEHQLGESVDDLKKNIRESMRAQEERTDRQRREGELFSAIRDATVVDLADELIAEEERLMIDDLGRQLEAQKMTFEDWLRQGKKTAADVQKEIKDESAKRLRLRFGIQKLLEEKQVAATPEEIAAEITAMLASVPPTEQEKAKADYAEGSQGYEEVKWRKRVEKLVEGMLG